ncbi:protein-L-isoaspartate(D-aspartate) O-methyltransferase [Sphaerisporangium sp. NBC_01403]|uniref:protein-L-isoaspartate(D-aspartate) O-methyltransferase n=1 Tax=Sphaerisporangium sp. NBC_01403 TaxID=2903599 RepID=UPI003248D32B
MANEGLAAPRHQFVPAWWQWSGGHWEVQYGPADEAAWLDAAYRDRTLVTKIGTLHADQAKAHDEPRRMTSRPDGPPPPPRCRAWSCRCTRHARIGDKHTILDVGTGTGTGYGTALLCHLFGDEQVTSIDVDDYVTSVAAWRLAELDHSPRIAPMVATGEIPWTFDRIVAMVSVRPIPASWLTALNPGGRLTTTISNTSLIVSAVKTDDGGAVGVVERDWAMFMKTRTGADYPPGLAGLMETARTADGEHFSIGRFPVIDIEENAWELRSMLEVMAPGIEHNYRETGDARIALMVHEDGSWARAEQIGRELPAVHHGGPRRLWDVLDEARDYWLQNGMLPLYGANVRITPDGTIQLQRGRWKVTIS